MQDGVQVGQEVPRVVVYSSAGARGGLLTIPISRLVVGGAAVVAGCKGAGSSEVSVGSTVEAQAVVATVLTFFLADAAADVAKLHGLGTVAWDGAVDGLNRVVNWSLWGWG